MTYYSIGIFEEGKIVNEAISALRQAGATENELTLLASADASEISHITGIEPESGALQGALAGTGIGGALGALGAVSAVTIPGVGLLLASGIIATLGGGVIGGYLGALYGMRAKTDDDIDIKNSLTPDSIILIAQAESEDTAKTYSKLLEAQGSQSTEIIVDKENQN